MNNPPLVEISYAPVATTRISVLTKVALMFAIISFPAGAGLSIVLEEALNIRGGWTEWTGFSIFAGGVTLGFAAALAALARGLKRGRWIAIAGLILCLAEILIALNLAHRVFNWF